MKEKTGFSIICNRCGHDEVLVMPLDEEMCVLECCNVDCQETTHYMKPFN